MCENINLFQSNAKLFHLLQIPQPKMTRLYFKLLFLTFYFIQSNAMMIRNDALISKMVSDFQKDNSMAAQQQHEQHDQQHELQDQKHELHDHQQHQKDVLAMMQNVLCRNFPTVPCDMIVKDETLKNLIQRSIQQLKYKKLSMEKTTQSPAIYQLTLFPSINSEDLSNVLQTSSSGYHKKRQDKQNQRSTKRTANINVEINKDREPKHKKLKKEVSRTLYNGHKKIRKFYPHKIKYKDKMKGRKDFGDYSEEKLSMSVEVPEMNIGVLEISRKRDRINYKADADDEDPVWRIDYLKHGEPGLNVFGNEPDRLKEKLVKTGPNVIVNDNILEPTPRKDVMHPDVYIKKTYRKNNLLELNSGALE